MSKAFAIIGMTKTGKSTSVFDILNKAGGDMYIFDVNKEYGKYNNLYKGSTDEVEPFLKVVKEVSNSVIVFEEATVDFQKGSKVRIVRKLLAGKRHKNNLIIFVFHNMRSIPAEIMSFVDFIVLRKTKDGNEYMEYFFKRTPENLEAFYRIKNHESPFYFEILNHSND